MSYEITNEQGEALGQFASNNGYGELVASVTKDKYPALYDLFERGASEHVDVVVEEIGKLSETNVSADVKSTLGALKDLVSGQDIVLITDGTSEDNGEDEGSGKSRFNPAIIPDELKAFDPNQPRDESGRWSSEGGGGSNVTSVPSDSFSSTRVSTEINEIFNTQYLKYQEGARAVHESIVASQSDVQVTRDNFAALTVYTSDTELNSLVRRGDLQDPERSLRGASKYVADLDDLLNRSRLSSDIVVFRGAKLAKSVAKQLKPGTVITDLGYMSTSTSVHTASDFSVSVMSRKLITPVLFRIRAQAGTRAFAVPDNISSAPGEREVLFGRGTSLKVTGTAKVNNEDFSGLVVYAQVHTGSGKSSKALSLKSSSSSQRLVWEDGEFEIQEPVQEEENIIPTEPLMPLPEEGKAFDPNEPRDDSGRWTGKSRFNPNIIPDELKVTDDEV